MLRIDEEQGQTINIPKAIYLYNEGIVGLDFKGLKGFIRNNFGNIKICLIKLKKKVVCSRGLLFDFIRTQKSFVVLSQSKIKDICHIVLTPKLFATFDELGKPHIRAAIFSYPSVISTSGIVEGPAKPKEYYILKKRYSSLGIWDLKEEEIKSKFKGRFIDYQDSRLIEVIKGYIAQALFFFMTQEPFCSKKRCRLYNSHWQEDLVYSQIKTGIFCQRHKRFLERLKK